MVNDFFVVFYWIGVQGLLSKTGLLDLWGFNVLLLLIGITGQSTVKLCVSGNALAPT